ncbi:hypothetical protein [Cohnella sp.]|uniref:hypothetical protein n=1 Tax=Cohnella sp. TaxID=1883426 RepID=UPI003563AD9A
MNEPQSPSLHGWNSGFEQNTFPGIGDSFAAGPPEVIQPTVLPAQVSTVTKSSLPFNISNLNDVKAIIDRMGGIEGVLSTVGKFQKFMSTIQQVAPLIKLFMGNKGSTLATANTNKRVTKRRRPTTRPQASKSRTRRPVKHR